MTGSPAKPPSGASAGEVDGAGREADRARRRRRPPPAEAAPEPAGEAGEASPSSFTFLLGFEYENASDGARPGTRSGVIQLNMFLAQPQ